METAYSCVLLAALLPLFFAGYAKFSSKGYDNASPREFLDKLQGRAKRAHYAQLNYFEAFPTFAASVIIAYLAGVAESQIAKLSVIYIFFRIIYGFCYVLDKAMLRSVVWFGAFFCVITLFVQAILHS